MSNLSRTIASLSPEKRALLLRKLSQQESGSNVFPLSFAQQRLWFLEQLEPDSAVYNIPTVVRLQGTLHAAALEQSLQTVVQRHEILRTTFTAVDGTPMQVVGDAPDLALPVVDLCNHPRREGEGEALRQIAAVAQKPFDLAQGPLTRAVLYRLAADDHLLLLVMHHIISDGWSAGVLIREAAAAYRAFAENRTPSLPRLPIQYADFAAWQRKWLQGEKLEAQLSYWRQRLDGAPALLELPTDRPRPPVQSVEGAYLSTTLPKRLAQAVKAFSRRYDVTPFMTLLAAFQVLLHRYSGEDDICVGAPIANRNRAETEGLIGFFVNTLVIRTDLAGEDGQPPSFTVLLGRVREATLDAYAHQDLPFELLVEELKPPRSQGHTPFFQVAFAYQNLPIPSVDVADLHLHALPLDRRTSKFDLTLSAAETADGLQLGVEYSTRLFDAETIQRLIGHFEVLLEGILEDPDCSIARLPILTEAERRLLLHEWTSTRTSYPRQDGVTALFEAQAVDYADAPAILEDGEAMSYAELNRRANQVARHLRRRGVDREMPVGICMDRSALMVTAILGVLKAGGVYVPLDPTYPRERIEFMLADTGARIILIQDALRGHLPAVDGEIIAVDTEWHRFAAEAEENLDLACDIDNLAYVMYTSGSTGRPKGIAIPQRGIVRLVRNTNYITIQPGQRIAMLSNSAFDAATFEVWGALLNGAALVVIPREDVLAPERLVERLRSGGVDSLFVTTALFNVIAASDPNAFAGVEHVLFGGEAADAARVRAVLAADRPPRHLANVYGPTESTTFTTWHRLASLPEDATNVPIGCAVANTQVYLLDAQQQPVPVGVIGELYIGGDGLARHYLNQPAMTAEKFVPHPFSQDGGERLYRTGDLARYLPDGSVEFLGRIDHQVKIRGFRIELDEIEAVLVRHPAVQNVVLAVTDDAAAGKRIVAYVVPAPGSAPSAADLRSFVRATLPDYMTPSAFVLIDAVPINANGKVDRAALPSPDRAQWAAADDFVAPRTPTEEMLAAIWTQLLGVNQISVHDNFFELGGHSLLVTQVISRLRELFQIEFPLRHLFDVPTVAALAERVDAARQGEVTAAAPPIVPTPRQDAPPLSFAQQRLWVIDQIDPGNPSFNIPGAVTVTGALDVDALRRSLNEIVRRHESLRTTFAAVDGAPRQVIAPRLVIDVPRIDLQSLTPDEREREIKALMAQEVATPFDLARGPLFRVRLLQLAADEHIVLFSMHHIVSDEWSLGVLVRELAALYTAHREDKPSSLPELPVQYADFAVWQRDWLQGDVLDAQLGWWRRHLAGAKPALRLPFDRPQPSRPTYQGALHSFALPEALSTAIKTLSREEGATLFMTLLAAFKTLLFRYTEQEEIVVGTDVANRNRVETEGLIGFFVNHLVLRTRLREDGGAPPTFRHLLRRVREAALGAYAHQDLPFDKLVSALQPERTTGHAPLFEVLFVLGNPTLPRLELPGLTFSPVGSAEHVLAKYDLSLFMGESEDAIRGAWRYSTERFDAETIARLSAHFETLLHSIVAQPDARIHTLDMQTEDERRVRVAQQQRRSERAKGLRQARRRTTDDRRQTTVFERVDDE